MTNYEELYHNALLADASYIDFGPFIDDSGKLLSEKDPVLLALVRKARIHR